MRILVVRPSVARKGSVRHQGEETAKVSVQIDRKRGQHLTIAVIMSRIRERAGMKRKPSRHLGVSPKQ
jgi:hypothetical protein